ncbi:hypothetical protein LZ518_05940 [Sphingomonas sp. RB56-2]|uniref:Nicotinamide riboside transporter PnuC n=1 Tax=Sphingomonas brevis TaxID=2908206 RepID=A0ABT0S8H0_9SPHN|nr:hypothetical protein [Sphingomonas brevis]MCL6740672.1 hypothetical protein [Sphingomonas brevis]
MGAFEFFFSFYGLLLGFSVAEVTGGLAGALNMRRRVKLGWLTPLLSLFIMVDIMGFWLFAWASRAGITISWAMMTGGLVVAVTYYLAASLVYPKDWDEWTSLDEHYWAQKRLVIAGVGLANIAVLVFTLISFPPQSGDWAFVAYQGVYWVPLLGLFISRKAKLDIVLLGLLVAQYLAAALNIVQSSQWGASTGI